MTRFQCCMIKITCTWHLSGCYRPSLLDQWRHEKSRSKPDTFSLNFPYRGQYEHRHQNNGNWRPDCRKTWWNDPGPDFKFDDLFSLTNKNTFLIAGARINGENSNSNVVIEQKSDGFKPSAVMQLPNLTFFYRRLRNRQVLALTAVLVL